MMARWLQMAITFKSAERTGRFTAFMNKQKCEVVQNIYVRTVTTLKSADVGASNMKKMFSLIQKPDTQVCKP